MRKRLKPITFDITFYHSIFFLFFEGILPKTILIYFAGRRDFQLHLNFLVELLKLLAKYRFLINSTLDFLPQNYVIFIFYRTKLESIQQNSSMHHRHPNHEAIMSCGGSRRLTSKLFGLWHQIFSESSDFFCQICFSRS